MIVWILTILRIIIGLLIIKTGFGLLSGNALFASFSGGETTLTGIFAVLIGVQIVCAALSLLVQEKRKHTNRLRSS